MRACLYHERLVLLDLLHDNRALGRRGGGHARQFTQAALQLERAVDMNAAVADQCVELGVYQVRSRIEAGGVLQRAQEHVPGIKRSRQYETCSRIEEHVTVGQPEPSHPPVQLIWVHDIDRGSEVRCDVLRRPCSQPRGYEPWPADL